MHLTEFMDLSKEKSKDAETVKLALDAVRRARQLLKQGNSEAAMEDLDKIMKLLVARYTGK